MAKPKINYKRITDKGSKAIWEAKDLEIKRKLALRILQQLLRLRMKFKTLRQHL